MLSHEDYQKIVNRLMNILGKNINIMDTKGVIIASGDSTRIGSFHEGAKIAASRKIDVIIDDSNIEYYKGTKKGINIPLFYNGEVIGVVGITGEPKEIIGFGRIIKELVELMVQEYENKKYETLHSRAMVSFIKEILNHPNIGHEEEKILESRAKLIGFDIKKQRSLIVADIRGFNDFILSKNLKEIDIQELKENIVEFIKSKLNHDEIVFNFNEDRFVIMLSSKNPMPFCKELQEGVKKKFNLSCIIGIGPDCKDIKNYHTSFTIANKLIDIGRKIDKDILDFKDYKIELLIHSLSINDSIIFFEEYKDILNSKNKDIINTIKVYFINCNIKCNT
ncbi:MULTISPECIES: CdaR family transcriptional regulator [Thermoanaerobacter]|uniref:Transcriptional regulator, CdaR n=3 Tax=Thermoanaerobacter TaxID=1754 RepID=B0K8P0_THEP3|nr:MULTISPECIES: sugar diacid recognition domain-containing protein [Thermoanaerobacter]ABY94503.1 transcriptional regulator, CdaR [Thermoanaerobacter pseudethanolicus ATCC 33223]ADV79455.1 sugar diacid recognition domain protein [Thermoanaerobacter brockii subsp. finnii Ako-1]